MGVYLDYNATTPIDDRVLERMVYVYKHYYGNADSRTHNYGEASRKVVVEARNDVANMLGVDSSEVFFTSGATESSNIAIQGLEEFASQTGRKHIITTTIEHKAVLETIRHLEKKGFDVDYVDPEENGRVSVEKVKSLLREKTLLVSIMHVNNETGIIQPVKEIGDILNGTDIFFHTDATQSCGKLIDEIRDMKYDLLSASAHKFYGPQGIGILVMRKKSYKYPPVKSIMYGGQQEHGLRPGTTPVALVAGLGYSCRLACEEYKIQKQKNKMIKSVILSLLANSGLKYVINGDQNYCVDNTINFSISGVESEALMLLTKNYCGISNGSACTSHSYSPSYVLRAMKIDDSRINESIRVSWGEKSQIDAVTDSFERFLEIAKGLCVL